MQNKFLKQTEISEILIKKQKYQGAYSEMEALIEVVATQIVHGDNFVFNKKIKEVCHTYWAGKLFILKQPKMFRRANAIHAVSFVAGFKSSYTQKLERRFYRKNRRKKKKKKDNNNNNKKDKKKKTRKSGLLILGVFAFLMSLFGVPIFTMDQGCIFIFFL